MMRLSIHICLPVLLSVPPGLLCALAQQPTAPEAEVTSLEKAVLVTWDSLAESHDPFSGYRLYRGRLRDGPHQLIRVWPAEFGVTPTRLFLDIGDDNADGSLTRGEGLWNEVQYFYVVTAYADSVLVPYRPFAETASETVLAIPRTASVNVSENPITLSGRSGSQGRVGDPAFVVRNRGNFRRLFEGHQIEVSLTTQSTGTEFVIPILARDPRSPFRTTSVLIPGAKVAGDPTGSGEREGTFVIQNLFSANALDLEIPWSFTQLADPMRLDTVIKELPSGADTPVFFRDTIAVPLVGLAGTASTFGESTYELEFLPGGVDTVNASSKQIFNYLNVRVTESSSGRELVPDSVGSLYTIPPHNHWTMSRYAYNTAGNPNLAVTRISANRYYVRTVVDSSAIWEFSNILVVENTRIVFDFADKGRSLGRNWPRAPQKATHDFEPADVIRIMIAGGIRGPLPYDAVFTFTVGEAIVETPNTTTLDGIRIVPNPYLIRHQAQISVEDPRLRFDYLPEVCTIQIYTVALDLVKTLPHNGGPVEYWDLRNESGERVGSQLFLALIETAEGQKATKKFSVVIGE